MNTAPKNGQPVAKAGGKSIKRLLADHLADAHGIWLARHEYRLETVQSVAELDPCTHVLVA